MLMAADELAARLVRLPSQKGKVCVGLDGFVDRIVRVVDQRIDDHSVTYIRTLRDYGQRLIEASGLSLNVELLPFNKKIGGNGPIMANALSVLGSSVSCIGAFGEGQIAPEFEEFRSRADIYSVADHACTDAYEFQDGKIIASVLDPLNNMTWESITGHIGTEEIIRLFDQADMIALNNWTMIPHMTEIWEKLKSTVFPQLRGRKSVFIDLADPLKRPRQDLVQALDSLSGFSAFGDVLLSCNRREAQQIAAALGIPTDETRLDETAARIRSALGIDCVAIHTLTDSFACKAGTRISAPGFYTEEPKISVGGGDHFNAGLAFGLLNGFSLYEALLLGSAVSGYYVRTGLSPDITALSAFLRKENT